MKKILFFLGFLLTAIFCFGQKFVESQELLPEPYQNAAESNFGQAVVVSGHYAVIGEEGYDNLRGRVTVYAWEKKNWVRVAVLLPSDPVPGQHFGHSVSMYGDTIAVGAPYDQEGGKECGAVYLFGKPKEGWHDMTETIKLIPKKGEDQRSGYSVALWEDLLVVGAPQADEQKGVVYLYVKNEKEWTGKEEAVRLVLSQRYMKDQLGFSVDAWGNMVVAGIPGKVNIGRVALFEKPADGWQDMTETAMLYNNRGPQLHDNVGFSVGIWGRTVVVGMNNYRYDRIGYALVYERPAGGWSDMGPTAKLTSTDSHHGDHFGSAVAVNGDTVVVGAYFINTHQRYSGAAYVYVRPSSGWSDMTESARLTASDAGSYFCHLGASVSIGNGMVLAGAPKRYDVGESSGAAYLFRKKAKIWKDMEEEHKFLPEVYLTCQMEQMGTALDIDGDYAVVGAPGYDVYRGRVYVYHYEGERWVEVAELKTSSGAPWDRFGYDVAIRGKTIAVGAPGYLENMGAVYLFEAGEAGWQDMTESACLVPPDSATGTSFGKSVAVGEGYVVAGAPYSDARGFYSGGIVCLYARPAQGWIDMEPTALLTPSDGIRYQYFGTSVAVEGSAVFIGAPGDDDKGPGTGSVYFFEKPAGGWTDMSGANKLVAKDGGAYKRFGEKVTSDHGALAVVSRDNVNGYYSGAVYVFERTADDWSSLTERAKLLPSSGSTYDKFGVDVDMEEERIVVGCSWANSMGEKKGAVYLYRKPAGGWQDTTESEKYSADEVGAFEQFGYSVALRSDRFLSGAMYANAVGYRSGAVYGFREYEPVVIAKQPHDSSNLCEEEVIQLEIQGVHATDYRWQISRDEGNTFTDLTDDAVFSGSRTEVLTVAFDASLDSTLFRCKVSNPAYVLFSDTVRLMLDTLFPGVMVQNDTVYLDDQGTAWVTADDVVLVAGDDCGVEDTVLSVTGFSCADAGSQVPVMVTVRDVNGNRTTATVWVRVEDTLSPFLEVRDITLQLGDSGYAVLTPADVVIAASDNCEVADTLLDRDTLTTADLGTVRVTVTLQDEFGNRTEKQVTVTVEDDTGLENLEAEGVRIYPNPAGDRLYLVAGAEHIGKLRMLDNAGRTVWVAKELPADRALDISRLQRGVYFLQITTDRGMIVRRFIKK